MNADHVSGGWVPARGPNLINNGHFDEDVSYWQAYGASGFAWVNGAAEVQVPGGTAGPFDILLVANVPNDAAGTYELSFKASASLAHSISVAYLVVQPAALTVVDAEYVLDFVTPDPLPSGQLQFGLGGNVDPWVFTLDDVRLERVA
jgi:endoglucanase